MLFLVYRNSFKYSFISVALNRSMAGHSKWANIKHVKAQKDEIKAVLFTKISRQIRLAIQEGKSNDPAVNSILRSEIDKAVKQNMPLETIQKTLKKFHYNKLHLTKHRLDIRYKKNVYVICIIYSDNFDGLKMNATAMVKKSGGVFVNVGHMFKDFGRIEACYDGIMNLRQGQSLEEKATEDAIELGAEEVEVVDSRIGAVNFICEPTSFNTIKKTLQMKGYSIENIVHVFTPLNQIGLCSEDQNDYNIFLQKLRHLPGIEEIYDNLQK